MIPIQTPPAQIQKAPQPDRDLAFPGFNGVALKGSVRAAEGAPWFAVMVAGSGPADRDWSSPVLRDPMSNAILPSHAGRDFAAWLQGQGLGSLRFDKRFVGSSDPKLDASLDAQVGDIKAALAAARALPEAKGRRLLLVGHDEGALLAMLAAGDADALLLLAPPGRSMAQSIRDQVSRQLPKTSAGPNLAYLDAVLEAIRKGGAAPDAGPQVFPNLVRLGKSLLAPESLGFVRATLDLDPWSLLARCPVPVAVAWGAKDIQTWRPERVPDTFKGAVIELPDANHVLRLETRPRELLGGSDAIATYTDGTPQADLSPLAAWIKALK
jgi:pimeloyl-ACP methyl ester carboxylesterase